MRRLFSTFATGPPGIGLLIIRLAAGAAVGFGAVGKLTGGLPIAQTALLILQIWLAVLLLAGLWTPVAGTLVAILTAGSLLWHRGDMWTDALAASLGIALALLGPGAWSIDARLFGWRRIEIPARPNQVDTRSEREL